MNPLRSVAAVLLVLALPAAAAEVAATFTTATTVPVTAAGYTATGNTVNLALGFAPPTGTNLTVVNNTGTAHIQGTFEHLAQGQRVILGFAGARYSFVANYYGGTGNDLVLEWANRKVYTWGRNADGQLGSGGIADGLIPGPIDSAGVLAGKIVTAVAAGDDFSLALAADGTLAAWGVNQDGQLGDGTTNPSPVPVAVTANEVLAGKKVIAIAAGARHCLALCSDGTLAAWGSGSHGQLGNGSYYSTNAPVRVSASGVLAGKTVTAIAAGASYCLALCADGTLAAWGRNSVGELGNNSTTGSNVPVRVTTSGVLAGKTVAAIAAGNAHSLALCADGTLAAWGYNLSGQLGTGNTAGSKVPVVVAANGILAGRAVAAIAAGSSHSLALCADGTLVAWGSNDDGQLGTGSTISSKVPVAVTATDIFAGKTPVAISSGRFHSRALCADGTLAAWGAALLGNGGTAVSKVPVAVTTAGMGPGEKPIRLGCGPLASHAAAIAALPLSSDATLAGLTLNHGTLTTAVSAGITSHAARVPHGTPSLTITPTVAEPAATVAVNGVPVASGTASPELVLPSSSGPIAITVTAADGLTTTAYTLTVREDATLAALGLSAGSLAPALSPDTTGYRSYVPTATTALILTPAATDGTAAILVNGESVISGTASRPLELVPGENLVTVRVTALDGTVTEYNLTIFRQIPLSFAFAAATTVPITADDFTAAGNTVELRLEFEPPTGTTLTVIENTGRGWIRGRFANLSHGQPVFLTYHNARYQFIANYYGGTGNDLVLQWARQKIYAWGSNADGQYGNDLITPGDVPVPAEPSGALAGKTVIALARGGSHSLALCADGSIVAWGAGDEGQLGDNRFTSGSRPVAVAMEGALAGKAVIAIAAGSSHNLALCADGTLVTWGNGNEYRGRDQPATGGVPVEVPRSGVLAGKTVVAIAAGYYHSLALCADGTLAAWGQNFSGQLANGSTADSAVPVAVKATGALAGKTITAIAAGGIHNLALCADGSLVTWGGNNSGQLGNGTISYSVGVVPTEVDASGVLAGKTIAAIAAGGSHCLVRCSDGILAAWGASQGGRLGTGTSANGWAPVPVAAGGVLAGSTVTSIIAGSTHSLVLCADGTPIGWGNISGSIGGSIYTDVPVVIPTASLGSGERITALAAGSSANHSLALAAVPLSGDSSLSAIALSLGRLVQPLTPGLTGYVASVPHGTTAVSVTPVASDPDAVITVNGLALYANGTSPPIAVASDVDIIILVTAPDGGTTSYTITVRGDSTLAGLDLSSGSLVPEFSSVVTAYTAYVPTATDSMTLTPTAADRPALIEVAGMPVVSGTVSQPLPLGPGENSIRVSVTAPDGHATTYQLTIIRQVPLVFSYATATAVPVTAAATYTATGNTAELALGFAPETGTRLTVVNHPGLGFITGEFSNLRHGQVVSLGYQNTNYHFWVNYYGGSGNDLVLEWVNNKTYAFGPNNYRQLGDGTGTARTYPAPVVASGVLAGKSITAVATGGPHSLALCSDGTLTAWGWNDYGQLGDGSIFNRDIPVAVSRAGILANKTVIAIAAGGGHSLALCADGTLAAWGSNSYGQLGNDTKSDSRWPVAVDRGGVLAGKTIIAIAAGEQHSLALCADGTLAAWGVNNDGQLGDGSILSRASPVAVTTTGILAGKTVVRIAAGAWRSFALCADGTLAAWGDNSSGALGNGTSARSPVPVDITRSGILAGKAVTAIASGFDHSLALCADGTLAAWGADSIGTLGTGAWVSSSLVPIAVDTTGVLLGKTVVTLCAGYSHSAALCSDGTLATWGNHHGAAGSSSSLAPTAVSTAAMGSGERFTVLAAGSSAYHLVAVAAAPDSANSRLAELTLNPGALTPAFSPGTTAYSVKVPGGTAALTVTPTAMAAGAFIEVNGTAVPSGSPSGPQPCAALPVTLTVKVTAPDGLTTTTYRFKIANAAPVFPGYKFATPYHTPAMLPLRKVVAKADDPDGDALTVTAAGPASAAGGTVELLADSIRYTPPATISGLDFFQVTIADSGGASVTGTVTVTVGPGPTAGGAGVNPPVLTVLPGGKMGIAFQGIPGRNYLVQRSIGGLDNWVALATLVADASGKVSYTDESPPPGSAFYRMALP